MQDTQKCFKALDPSALFPPLISLHPVYLLKLISQHLLCFWVVPQSFFSRQKIEQHQASIDSKCSLMCQEMFYS